MYKNKEKKDLAKQKKREHTRIRKPQDAEEDLEEEAANANI